MGSHRLHPGEELTVVTTAYIARVAELLDKAEAVWGDKASARQFLLGYQSLLGAAPLDLVASGPAGSNAVEALLDRVDHGIAV